MSFETMKMQPQTMPKEEFFAKARALTAEELQKLSGVEKERGSFPENVDSKIATTFQNPETGKETEISFDIEKEMAFFEKLYQENLGLSFDREKIISIWKQNYQEIKKEIAMYGYDSMLIIPDGLPKEEILNQSLIETIEEDAIDAAGNQIKKKVAATWQSNNFKEGGSFAGISNSEGSKYRIVLNHSEQNMYNNPDANPFLGATLGKNIMDLTGLDPAEVKRRIAGNQEMSVNFETEIAGQKIQIQAEGQTLEQYLIAQKAFFEKTGKHLDESGWTWLMKSYSGSRVVGSDWDPDGRRLAVDAYDPVHAHGDLGLRLSRSFS